MGSIVKVKIIDAHRRSDEDGLTLNEYAGLNDGDIISAEIIDGIAVCNLAEDGEYGNAGDIFHVEEGEYEVVE